MPFDTQSLAIAGLLGKDCMHLIVCSIISLHNHDHGLGQQNEVGMGRRFDPCSPGLVSSLFRAPIPTHFLRQKVFLFVHALFL